MRRSRLRSPPRGEDDAELGSGPTGGLAHDSRNSPCGWVEFGRGLGGSGHRVVVFAYPDGGAAAEPNSVNEALRVAGARRYVLIGASLGGRVGRRPATASAARRDGRRGDGGSRSCTRDRAAGRSGGRQTISAFVRRESR